MLTDDEAAALPAEEKALLSVVDGRTILMLPPARFVNHSCSPNARGTGLNDVAIRAIEAGEEIMVDYSAEQVPGLRLRCNCRAPDCRGLMT